MSRSRFSTSLLPRLYAYWGEFWEGALTTSSFFVVCLSSTYFVQAWLTEHKLDSAKSVCALATAHLVASWAPVIGA